MGCHMLLSDGVAGVLKGRAGRAGWLAAGGRLADERRGRWWWNGGESGEALE